MKSWQLRNLLLKILDSLKTAFVWGFRKSEESWKISHACNERYDELREIGSQNAEEPSDQT